MDSLLSYLGRNFCVTDELADLEVAQRKQFSEILFNFQA